jgi:hypothetical protein
MHSSPNQTPLLGKSRVIRNRFNPGGFSCSCCNPFRPNQHGSRAKRRGRQAERQSLRRAERQTWRLVELDG